jgi:hypothetical protein
MAAVAFGGMRRYAVVRLYPLVVVRWAAEGGEYTKMLLSIFNIRLCFFLSRGTWDHKRKKRD